MAELVWLRVGASGGGFEDDVEVVGVDGAEEGLFPVDLVGMDELGQRFLEGERAPLFG